MSKDKISDYSATANSNTDIGGVNIDEGCAPSGINDAIRTLMKQIKDLYAGTSGDTWPIASGGTGSGTASGARTNLGLGALATKSLVVTADITDANVTQAKLATNVAGTGPAFSAYMLNGSADQTVSSATFTKVKIDTEDFDTNTCYDTTAYRFTPNVAGYYQINGGMSYSSSTSATRGMLLIYKNGSAIKRLGDMVTTGNGVAGGSLVYMNGSTDYVELYAYIIAVTARIDYGPSVSWFNGTLARAA